MIQFRVCRLSHRKDEVRSRSHLSGQRLHFGQFRGDDRRAAKSRHWSHRKRQNKNNSDDFSEIFWMILGYFGWSKCSTMLHLNHNNNRQKKTVYHLYCSVYCFSGPISRLPLQSGMVCWALPRRLWALGALKRSKSAMQNAIPVKYTNVVSLMSLMYTYVCIVSYCIILYGCSIFLGFGDYEDRMLQQKSFVFALLNLKQQLGW